MVFLKKKLSVKQAETVIVLVLLLAVLLPQLIGTVEMKSAAGDILTPEDLNGRSFATTIGSVYEEYIRSAFPSSEIQYVTDWSDMSLCVEQGKADAFLIERSSLQEQLDAHEGLVPLPLSIAEMSSSFAAPRGRAGEELTALFNEFLGELRSSGELDVILARWEDTENAPDHVDIPSSTGERGVLRMVSSTDWSPFCYVNNGNPCGYFVELGYRFCAWAGYTPEFEFPDFQGALAGLTAGKYDFFCYGMIPGPEREEIYSFTEPVYTEPVFAVVRREDCAFRTTELRLSDVSEDMTFAAMTGADPTIILQEMYPNGEYLLFDTMSEIYYAVSTGKADVGVTYRDNFRTVMENFDNLAFLPGPAAYMDYSFAMQKTPEGAALRDEYNAFITRFRESGEFDAVIDKWNSNDPAQQKMADYVYTGEKGTLQLSTSGTWEPMTYYQGTELTGELVELACAFCADCGYTPEFSVLPFPSQLTGLLAGEYDMLVDAIGITPEREESVSLTAPYLHDTFCLLTRADAQTDSGTVSKAGVFVRNLQSSFSKNFLRENRWQLILSGLGVTAELSVMAGIFGSLLGAGICALRMSKKSFLTGFARIYIKLIQSTPIVVLLMVLYYVVFGDVDIKAFWVCALGFSLDFAAYSAEIFRSGVESVPEGQKRAAKALGFSRTRAFTKVVLPQAAIRILPVFSGQFIATVKLTSVAGYITVQDLTKVSDIIRSRTYEAFFPLISTAVIYFLISAALVSLLKLAEKRIDPMQRSRTIKGVSIRAD